MIRGLAIIMVLICASLVAACTAGRGSSPAAAMAVAPVATANTSTPAPTPRASRTPAPPSAGPVSSTRYTADDRQVATLIEDGAAVAIPQLRILNKTEPAKQVAFFEPVGTWIASEKAGLAGLAPTTCTAPAAALFTDALKQYDTMRRKFLAWKDWGAHGHAYSPGAPMAAVRTLEDALAELDAHCPR